MFIFKTKNNDFIKIKLNKEPACIEISLNDIIIFTIGDGFIYTLNEDSYEGKQLGITVKEIS